ncbi:MAG TPA: hypothetical protein VL970_13820, partial [Candidatus Acidoferrales bacterium]|nr:hypothetical protein [Candidatus Acidoferrales bacterium]
PTNNEGFIVSGGNVQIGNAAIGRNARLSVTLQESLAKVEAVKDQPDLQQALKDLCAQVAELTKRLPPERQDTVARDLNTFVTETTSAQPRKAWYDISGAGLIEAAKAVVEFAGPVAKSVKLVMGLLP